jgi:hypothetical protein
MQKKHSFVHDIRIATPCKADWNKMSGDERVRFCGQCKLNVYNISEMTTDEAEKLIIEKEGKLCVRMYRRTDGTLLNKDCPIGLLKRRCQAAFGAISAAASLFAVWFLHARPSITQGSLREPMTGEIAMPIHEPSMVQGGMVAPLPETNNSPVTEVYLGGRHGDKP